MPSCQCQGSGLSLGMSAMLQWLGQEGPQAPKHRGWKHPLSVVLFHFAVVIPLSLQAHDWLIVNENSMESDQRIACFLLAYSVWFLSWRLSYTKKGRWSVLYSFTFLCNVTLVMSGVAHWLNRPILAQAYCLSVAIDQLLWYVDICGYLLTKKCPIGVCTYLLKESNWKLRCTSTHHLWTLPLLLRGGVHSSAWPLSLLLTCLNVLLSRWLVPRSIEFSETRIYLNVNLAHELWRDIHIKALQINHPKASVYLFRLLWRWLLFQTMTYGVCRLLFN